MDSDNESTQFDLGSQNLGIENENPAATSMIDLPTSNFQAFNFGPNAPPSYVKTQESNAPKITNLFKSVEYAKSTTTGSYESFQKLLALFFCSVTITVILIVLMALPFAMVVIGGIYIKQCTFQIMIPIWLIVFGSLLAIKNLSTLIQRIKALNQADNKPSSTMLNVFDSLMTLIIIVWFLCGNYWVYHDRDKVQFVEPEKEETYCNRTTFLFTFWFLNSVYILLFASVFLFCCTIFFTIFIPAKK